MHKLYSHQLQQYKSCSISVLRAEEIMYGNVSFKSVANRMRGNFWGTVSSFQVWDKFRTTSPSVWSCESTGSWYVPGWWATGHFFLRSHSCVTVGVEGRVLGNQNVSWFLLSLLQCLIKIEIKVRSFDKVLPCSLLRQRLKRKSLLSQETFYCW